MELFEVIEEIAEQGYGIDYQIIDQYGNGCEKDIEKGLKPPVTYTVYVTRLSDTQQLYSESFDHIKDCLEAGVKYVVENIKNVKI